jgi:hypothetical protein
MRCRSHSERTDLTATGRMAMGELTWSRAAGLGASLHTVAVLLLHVIEGTYTPWVTRPPGRTVTKA